MLLRFHICSESPTIEAMLTISDQGSGAETLTLQATIKILGLCSGSEDVLLQADKRARANYISFSILLLI